MGLLYLNFLWVDKAIISTWSAVLTGRSYRSSPTVTTLGGAVTPFARNHGVIAEYLGKQNCTPMIKSLSSNYLCGAEGPVLIWTVDISAGGELYTVINKGEDAGSWVLRSTVGPTGVLWQGAVQGSEAVSQIN